MLSFERNNQIMQRARLPPGFRFHPTDEELVGYYLKRKILGRPFHFQAISEIDIYKFAPWDLPERSCLRSNDLEWYFFCPRDRKYASGSRANRATEIGYWKTTGKDRTVCHNSEVIGMKKTLVFHTGRAPHGIRTDWVMHEYRFHDEKLDFVILQDAYVLCRIYEKSGPGPKNGEQYGGPFNEEEWNDDEVDGFELSIRKISEHSNIFEKCTLEQCKSSSKLQDAKSEECNGSSSIPANKDKENSVVLSHPSIGDTSCVSGDEIYTGLEDILPCVETSYENPLSLFSLHDFDLEDGGFVEMNDLLPPTESNLMMNANLSNDTHISEPPDFFSSILKSDTSATDS